MEEKNFITNQKIRMIMEVKYSFYEIIKNDANGYECGRERCDDIVTAYIRFSTLMNVFPEYTIKMNFVTEKEIHTVMKFPVR